MVAASTEQEFIQKARVVHDDRYRYNNVVYKHARQKVSITCPIHGDYTQTPNSHLNGNGCPACGKVGGFTERRFANDPQLRDTPSTPYLIRVSNGQEQALKIGITTREINDRFRHIGSYTVDTICQVQVPLHTAFTLEQEFLHTVVSQYRKVPWMEHTFSGHTECFVENETTLALSMKFFSSILDSPNKETTTNV